MSSLLALWFGARRRLPVLRPAVWSVVGAVAVVGAAPGVALASAGAVRVGTSPVVPSGARLARTLPAASGLQATVTLNPRDPVALSRFATAVSTPGNSLYKHYLTPAQFAAAYAPTAAQRSAVRGVLAKDGLSPGAVTANGLSIEIHGSAATFSKAFGTGFEQYRLAGGRVAYANQKAPLLPASIAGTVQAVVGLDNLVLAHSGVVKPKRAGSISPDIASPHVVTGGPQPCAAATAQTAGGIAFTADQLAAAYSFSSCTRRVTLARVKPSPCTSSSPTLRATSRPTRTATEPPPS